MLYSSVRRYTYPIKIGAQTHIGARCLFTGANGCLIEIGSDCDIAPEVVFLTGTHEVGSMRRRAEPGLALPGASGQRHVDWRTFHDLARRHRRRRLYCRCWERRHQRCASAYPGSGCPGDRQEATAT